MLLHDIAGIIKSYMDLEDNQIWIKDEKYPLPSNDTFTIAIGFMSLKGMGSSSNYVILSNTTMQESIGTNMYGQISVDILGRTFDVVTRKEEIIQAMNSMLCKETQIAKGFMIAGVPSSMNDISGLDGSAIPYRFQITFAVQFFVTKLKNVDFYDTFEIGDIYVTT